jgi:DNA-binding SARP family transcriptional activator
VEFRILGPLEVVTPSGPLPLGGPKQRALLGVLLLDAGAVVSTDRLIAALWADEPPESAVNVVQGHVRDLRRLLGRDALVTRPPGYLLRAGDEQMDAHRFEQLVCEGRRRLASEPAIAAARLREALAVWRGPVLADVAFPSVQSGVTRLEDLRLAALEDRIEADLALGAHAELAGELRALLSVHPGRERLCGQLMLALYRAGRQEEALAAYGALRNRLREDLGIDPAPELRRLERSILRQEPSLLLPSSSAGEAPPGAAVGEASAAPPPQARAGVWRRRAPLLAIAALVVVGASSLGVLRTGGGTSAPPPPCPQGTTAADPRRLGPGLGVLATTAHSCDANSQGVWPRAGPAHDAARVPPALGEGTPIHVVCQDRHGGLVIDTKLGLPPRPSSTVWDRLEDGSWISDIYTSVPKQPGETPPLGLPVC